MTPPKRLHQAKEDKDKGDGIDAGVLKAQIIKSKLKGLNGRLEA